MPLGAFKTGLMGASGATAAGDVVLIRSQTGTGVSEIDFTSGITSTYGEYIFKFYNMNPETDLAHFSFQVNASDDEGGGYDTSLISSTHFNAEHKEQPTRSTQLAYQASFDLPQSASFQRLVQETGNDADETCVGELHLFNPSSTTYVKHFLAVTTTSGDYARHGFTSGYINDTTAITQVRFKFSSGDFDGTIKLWGVK